MTTPCGFGTSRAEGNLLYTQQTAPRIVAQSRWTAGRLLLEKVQAECISSSSSKQTKQSLQSAIQRSGFFSTRSKQALPRIPDYHYSSTESKALRPPVVILDHCGFRPMFLGCSQIMWAHSHAMWSRAALRSQLMWAGNPDVFGPGDLCSRSATPRCGEL